MYLTKEKEVRKKAKFYAYLLIKDVLYVHPTNKEITNSRVTNLDNFEEDVISDGIRFKEMIEFENFNDYHLRCFFETLEDDIKIFNKKDWKEFCIIYDNIDDSSDYHIPERLKYLFEPNYMKTVQEIIEKRRSFVFKNYLKIRDELLANNQSKEIITTNKLKTNLSVPELALLFKLIKDLKPDIFDTNTDTELYQFISKNFQTKRTGDSDISIQKLRILFNQPDYKAAEFWEEKLRLMLSDVKKLK